MASLAQVSITAAAKALGPNGSPRVIASVADQYLTWINSKTDPAVAAVALESAAEVVGIGGSTRLVLNTANTQYDALSLLPTDPGGSVLTDAFGNTYETSVERGQIEVKIVDYGSGSQLCPVDSPFANARYRFVGRYDGTPVAHSDGGFPPTPPSGIQRWDYMLVPVGQDPCSGAGVLLAGKSAAGQNQTGGTYPNGGSQGADSFPAGDFYLLNLYGGELPPLWGGLG